MSRTTETTTDASPFRRAAGGAVAAAGAALIIAALIFSNSFAAQQVAEDALVLDYAEATLGANDIAVKSLGQAILLAEDERLGVADAATSDAALTEARFSISELRERATSLINEIGSDADLAEAASIAIDGADEVVALLENGAVGAAGSCPASVRADPGRGGRGLRPRDLRGGLPGAPSRQVPGSAAQMSLRKTATSAW